MRLGTTFTMMVAALVLAVSPAAAKSYRADSYNSAIEILENGDLRITERIQFRFGRGPFTHVHRSLPFRKVDDIEIESSPEVYEVDRSNRRVKVTWNFEPISNTSRTFTLTYRVRGVFSDHEGVKRLVWRAFADQRSYRITDATADLSWPSSWSEPVAVSARPGRTRIERRRNGIHFDVGKLDNETTLRVRADFDAAVASIPPPQWQQRRAAWTRRAPLVGAIAAGLLILGIVIVLGIHREVAPRAPRGLPQVSAAAPPSDLPAVLAGALRQGDAGILQSTACFLDLARRGYVRFDTTSPKRWGTSGQYTVRRVLPGGDLESWERLVLDAAFRGNESGAVPVGRAWAGIRKSQAAFRAAVRDVLRKRGDLDPGSDIARRYLFAAAAVAGFLGLVAIALVPIAWSLAGPWLFLPGSAILLVSVVALVAASAIPRHTLLGRQHAGPWEGFARHLKSLCKQREPLDTRRFQEWFPYAVALGVAPAWLQAGKRWQLQAPAWFDVPAGVDGMSGMTAVFASSGAVAGAAGGGGGGAGGGGSGAG